MAFGSIVFPLQMSFKNMKNNNEAGIALQLYTVRDDIEKDIAGTLKKVAEAGYCAVETAFWPGNISVKQAAKYLQDAGLSVCSAHIDMPLNENKSKMLEIAEAFNCTKMIWHGWPEDKRYSIPDGIKALADIYNEASRFAVSNGLKFGLHNHWWEYNNKVDGRYVYELLLASVDKDIFFELDTYWVKVAGHDPAKIVSEFGARAPFLHMKDGPANWHDSLSTNNPDPMVALGQGIQNFKAIKCAGEGSTQWMVVEMDIIATNVFTAIRESYDYLVKNKLAGG